MLWYRIRHERRQEDIDRLILIHKRLYETCIIAHFRPIRLHHLVLNLVKHAPKAQRVTLIQPKKTLNVLLIKTYLTAHLRRDTFVHKHNNLLNSLPRVHILDSQPDHLIPRKALPLFLFLFLLFILLTFFVLVFVRYDVISDVICDIIDYVIGDVICVNFVGYGLC